MRSDGETWHQRCSNGWTHAGCLLPAVGVLPVICLCACLWWLLRVSKTDTNSYRCTSSLVLLCLSYEMMTWWWSELWPWSWQKSAGWCRTRTERTFGLKLPKFPFKYDGAGSGRKSFRSDSPPWNVAKAAALMWAAAWPRRNEVAGIHVNSLTSLLWRPRQRKKAWRWKEVKGVCTSPAACALTDHRYCQPSVGWTTKHCLKLHTPCQPDNAVTTPGLCTILSRPACHLLELFHGCGDANTDIKAFLCARKCLTLGAFSNFGRRFCVFLPLTVISHSL